MRQPLYQETVENPAVANTVVLAQTVPLKKLTIKEQDRAPGATTLQLSVRAGAGARVQTQRTTGWRPARPWAACSTHLISFSPRTSSRSLLPLLHKRLWEVYTRPHHSGRRERQSPPQAGSRHRTSDRQDHPGLQTSRGVRSTC